MRRPLFVLAVLVLALASFERWLQARETRVRHAERRVGRLFTTEEAASLRKQPALRIEGKGEAHAYGRIEGQWRCLSYHQAPCDGAAIQELLDGIVGAEGIVHADEVEEAPTFGINTPHTLRLSIQGPQAMQNPDGDVVATLEIGAPAGGGACFVRRKGTKEIWSIAGDLRAPIESRVAAGLPPFLEAAAVPRGLFEQGLARITLEFGRERRVIERRERTLDPAQMQPGVLPWKWVLLSGEEGNESEEANEVSATFASFLEHLPYVDVLASERRDSLGFDTPRATIALQAQTGPPLVLTFGAVDLPQGVPLWMEATRTLYSVEPAVFALALPETSLLHAPPGVEDPWSAALSPGTR